VNAQDVTAIIVTRGDVDLTDIIAALPYGEVVVWDNSTRPWDARCYGRYLAIDEASNPVVYFQDDDLIFTGHAALLAAYKPGEITCNMPSPWYERTGYDKLHQALVGAGSLVDRDLPKPAIDRYLARWPLDDLFLTYVDVVVGMLTAHTRHDLGYTILPYATAPGRIYTTEGAGERKAQMQRRALELRGW
jgi:hypothetical protein